MLLLLDNYDSFTYNLAQYLNELGVKVLVQRNDKITIKEILELNIQGIVISPGPGKPEEAGISMDIIKYLGPTIPILGVCLGHQSIGHIFGGKIIKAPKLIHGKPSIIYHNQKGIFSNLKNPIIATRYHSLIIEKESCPAELEITAWTEDGLIMGVQHKQYKHIQGIQFHPESILTESGKQMLQNFISSL
uniref:Anthranilate synthase component 2 n=1 Tax=Cyanophora biloba TaxID=1489483 RepID=A0A2Z4HGY8_9EUKA|nr:anthranilate synthase component 2 [Cyanophora biloba]AWW13811.1 anthranilate synthase component 2 [Cyanophora biloba]